MKSGNGLHTPASLEGSSLAGALRDTSDHDLLLDPVAPAEAGSAPDPFDPAALRLPNAFTDTVGVRKLLTKVPVRRPKRQEWVTVHPAPSMRLTPAAIIEDQEDGENFLVVPALSEELAGEFSPSTLFLAQTRQGVTFLWVVKLPREDGRSNDWQRTSLQAAELAMKGWVRVTANRALGAYDVACATTKLADPEWPSLAFAEILQIAFRDNLVDRLDHPLVKRLRTGKA